MPSPIIGEVVLRRNKKKQKIHLSGVSGEKRVKFDRGSLRESWPKGIRRWPAGGGEKGEKYDGIASGMDHMYRANQEMKREKKYQKQTTTKANHQEKNDWSLGLW